MEVRTARMILREAGPDDAARLAAYQGDPRYLEHYSERPNAEQIVASIREWASATPRLNFQFIVTRAVDGSVIGCAGVRRAGCPADTAEIGIELDPVHWGVGLAAEALRGLIAFAENDLGLHCLEAETVPTNLRAQRLVERLGFDRVSGANPAVRFRLKRSAAEPQGAGKRVARTRNTT